MEFKFKKATKEQSFGRWATFGPPGSGKTYTSLIFATCLAKLRNSRVAYIDSEHGSASKYADIFDFDVINLDSFSPIIYVQAINAAENTGYRVIVIDSLSHAWNGKDGALEMVDRIAGSGNKFSAWRTVTPQHNDLVESMLRVNADLFVTMRSKVEYVVEKDDRGKAVPRKVGLAPIQREGLEYEFDVVADMDTDNILHISKTRCPTLTGQHILKPADDVIDIFSQWLTSGEKPRERITKSQLAEFAKQLSMEPVEIGEALNARKMMFDEFRVEEMKQAIIDFARSRQNSIQTVNNVL